MSSHLGYNSSKSSSSSSEDSSKRTISYEAPSHSFSNKDCTISEGNKTAKEISWNISKMEELKVLDSAAKSVKQEKSMLFTSESESIRMFSLDPQNEWKSGGNCKISLSSETKKSKGRSKSLSQRVYLPCSSYINIEENTRSKRLVKNIEDKEAHSDEGGERRAQKLEKQVKIKFINKIFNKALYNLESFVHKNKEYEYGSRVSENIYGSLRKENIIRSLGVYTDRGSSMFIFSLTKECKVFWEIYTKHFNHGYTWNILDLLRVTDHLYFYEILEFVNNEFSNAWSNLCVGLVDIDLENNLKSIAFTPFSPNEVIKGPLDKLNLKRIKECFKDIKSWRYNINLIFKSFEFKDMFTLKRLLIL